MSDLTKKYLWVEKYMPSTIDEVIIPSDDRKIFNRFIKEKNIPHILLYGRPGSGKTTIARILIDNIIEDDSDVFMFNGSVDTGVDNLRENVDEFLKTPSFGGSIKIVFIDEADHLSPNAQAALRGIIEKYQDTGRFIFTCNYLYKITPALQSRLGQSFEFKQLPMEYVRDFCKNVLEKENIKYEEAALEKVIATHYPDVRKIIHLLQSRCVDKELLIKAQDLESKEKLFISNTIKAIKGVLSNNSLDVNNALAANQSILAESEIDYMSTYEEIFYNDEIPIWAKVTINAYCHDQAAHPNPSMHMMSMLYNVIKNGKELIMVTASSRKVK